MCCRVDIQLTPPKDNDADQRYMALSDLTSEITKAKLDAGLQKVIREKVIVRLNDKVKDVSTAAIKWLDLCLFCLLSIDVLRQT